VPKREFARAVRNRLTPVKKSGKRCSADGFSPPGEIPSGAAARIYAAAAASGVIDARENALFTTVVILSRGFHERLGVAILSESALSFLGLGPSPPTPSWGLMISEGLAQLRSAWWISTIPGLAITVVVLAFNLLGDGLRDALDPRLRRRG
jgi:hypothetical protein